MLDQVSVIRKGHTTMMNTHVCNKVADKKLCNLCLLLEDGVLMVAGRVERAPVTYEQSSTPHDIPT